jgi:hypothetical protein
MANLQVFLYTPTVLPLCKKGFTKSNYFGTKKILKIFNILSGAFINFYNIFHTFKIYLRHFNLGAV